MSTSYKYSNHYRRSNSYPTWYKLNSFQRTFQITSYQCNVFHYYRLLKDKMGHKPSDRQKGQLDMKSNNPLPKHIFLSLTYMQYTLLNYCMLNNCYSPKSTLLKQLINFLKNMYLLQLQTPKAVLLKYPDEHVETQYHP